MARGSRNENPASLACFCFLDCQTGDTRSFSSDPRHLYTLCAKQGESKATQSLWQPMPSQAPNLGQAARWRHSRPLGWSSCDSKIACTHVCEATHIARCQLSSAFHQIKKSWKQSHRSTQKWKWCWLVCGQAEGGGSLRKEQSSKADLLVSLWYMTQWPLFFSAAEGWEK